MSEKTAELITTLLRREFDSYSVVDLLYLGEGKRLTDAALDLGLNDLASEFISDLNCELQRQRNKVNN